MSVHKIEGVRAPTYEVRWRPVEGPQRSRRFKTESEAEAFDVAVRARVALERARRRWNSAPAAGRRQVQAIVHELTGEDRELSEASA
jgi:hypothetical protein